MYLSLQDLVNFLKLEELFTLLLLIRFKYNTFLSILYTYSVIIYIGTSPHHYLF